MRMSEAMRRGTAMRPQCRSTMFNGVGSCAVGAAMEGAGIELVYTLHELTRAYPEWTPILNALVTSDANSTARYCWLVMTYLNDERKWTREDIADWLKGVENKLIADGKYIPCTT